MPDTSHAAYTLSIGLNTAPFLASSTKEKSISLNPCETEYKTLIIFIDNLPLT